LVLVYALESSLFFVLRFLIRVCYRGDARILSAVHRILQMDIWSLEALSSKARLMDFGPRKSPMPSDPRVNRDVWRNASEA